jgi:leucyl aminopeptidase (aminopeptidase T)
MLNFSLVHEARMIIRDFVKVRPGERVTIVTDAVRADEGIALALAADEAGAQVATLDISQHVASLLSGGEFWSDPPAHVLAAIQASNVSILTVDETYAFRFDHHVKEMFRTGPDCSVYKVDLGLGTWGLTRKDIAIAQEIGMKIMNAISGSDVVRVTTACGTDISLSIAGRACLPVTPIPERGMPYGTPIPLWSEYNWAPIEDSANGTVIVNGISEATPKLHTVAAPVEWTVKNGRVVEVRGGVDADDFCRLFEIDPGAAVIGELGIGANPKAIYGTETEKAMLGTVHFGLGDNSGYPGGLNRSAVHVDAVIRQVTIAADGRLVVENGRLAG